MRILKFIWRAALQVEIAVVESLFLIYALNHRRRNCLYYTLIQGEIMNAKNVLSYAADQEARFISVRFTDLVGAWHHLSFPIDQLTEDSFEDGFGFDASSLRGWAATHESDM